MAEPSSIWSQRLIRFDDSISLTQNVILSHAWVALQALVRHIDHLRELVKTSPAVHEFHLAPEIPSTLADLCFQQGLASTLLFNDAPKGSRENASIYQLRIDRIVYVKAKCGSISVSVLSDRKVRNVLTHADEYLAKALAEPNTGWFIDSAFGRRNQFDLPAGLNIGYSRVYISSEDVLLHLGYEISLAALKKEAENVLGAVWGSLDPAITSKPLFTLRKNE